MEKQASNYYKETIPKLIEKYKSAVTQCLDIIGQDMDDEISDDKLHNVLKSKRMAGEDAKYYAQQIDLLENEMNGVDAPEEKENATKRNWTKSQAKPPS